MRGSIVKRGKNSWAVVVSLGKDPATGRHKQKWYSHSKKSEAEAHLNEILAQIQQGTWTPPAKVRVADYLERWLADYAARAVRPTTLDSYRMIVRTHLTPALGHIPLSLLSPLAIQRYFTGKLEGRKDGEGKWEAEPLSASTVRRHAAVLHRALRSAVKWGLLVTNPVDRAELPKPPRFEARVWDAEQVKLFLGEAKRSSPHYALYLAALTTGARAGELLGLRWQDVDLALATASIQQTFYRLGGNKKEKRVTQMLFNEPKSARSRRSIALPAVLVEELRRLQEAQKKTREALGSLYSDYGLVFCQPEGKPLHLNNIARRDFRRVAKKAKLPRIRFHDLRHSHASLLLKQGENPKVVQERLGHSTAAFTLQVYSHLLPGMQAQATARLEESLFGAPSHV